MKKHKLNHEEQEILTAFERGELSPTVDSQDQVKRLTKIFKAAGNKSKRVSLRMHEWDYIRAKELALQDGLPYQTLLSSILHKYFTGKLIEVRQANA